MSQCNAAIFFSPLPKGFLASACFVLRDQFKFIDIYQTFCSEGVNYKGWGKEHNFFYLSDFEHIFNFIGEFHLVPVKRKGQLGVK